MRYEGGDSSNTNHDDDDDDDDASTKNVLQIGSYFSHIYLRSILRNAAFNKVQNLFVAEFRVEELLFSKVLKCKM